MRIAKTYSHLNGLEYLQVHQLALWTEIREVIASIDAADHKTKQSKEKRMMGEMKYSPKALNLAFDVKLTSLGWAERRVKYWVTDDQKLISRTMHLSDEEQKRVIVGAGKTPIYSYNQTDFVKNRIALEIQLGKYSFVAYDLFVKHLAFFVRDEIDVGVEVLPMKSLQQEMSSGPGYYEGELYNIIRNGRGVPAVPLVLVGIAP